jgi:hypothetical protein
MRVQLQGIPTDNGAGTATYEIEGPPTAPNPPPRELRVEATAVFKFVGTDEGGAHYQFVRVER